MLGEIIWNERTLAVAGTFAVPIVAILSAAWAKVERARSANDLKRRMIDRGMSPDEIERVLSAHTFKE